MKRSVLMACAMFSCTGIVHAQNSVTLYGLIDEGLDFTSNVGGNRLYSLSSGDVQGSRWGLRGSEDLGGGLSAIFKLESGFNLNNGKLGQQGRGFGRQAYVGISSSTFGALTLGRQYDAVDDYLASLTANGNWGGGLFTHPYDNDNTDFTFRLNNAIKYTSVDYGGFSFGGVYAMSNASNFGSDRAVSVGAQYVRGPISIAAAYLSVDHPNGSSAGAVSNGPNGNPDGSWTAAKQRVLGAGIAYTIGSATLGFVYTNTYLSQPTSTIYANLSQSPTLGAASSIRFNNFEVNAKYQVNPSFWLGGMYTFTQATYNGTSGSGKPKYHQFGLMADYNLSKRTDVYVQGAYVKVANSSSVAGTGLDVAANPQADGPSSTSNQVMARIGIRHKF
ncbi:porin [Burkholderia sp. Ac-20345]|uniref:porin n=1 Tax=Burkholderia sp. Ac-20345 TaxID=2703891 RepID=UPI003217A672